MAIIAAIQMSSSDDIDANLRSIEHHVIAAKQKGSCLVLLPENCVFIGAMQDESRKIAEPVDGSGYVLQWFSNIAKKHNIWIFVGGFPTIECDKIYQTLIVFNSNGSIVDFYHKRHLFDVTLPNIDESYKESDRFAAGSETKVIETPWGRVGLAICYDLRFPEHFRSLVDKGAELFLLPAAFTYATGKAHWEVLLRSRAIENQCFVLASAQYGMHPGNRKTWGNSMLIDSWGNIIDCIHNGNGMAIGEWDLTRINKQRNTFPALAHRIH